MLVLLVALAGGGYFLWQSNAQDSQTTDTDAILHAVERDEFILAVTERGEIQSSGVTEIRSLVKTKNTPGVAILKIVPEGTKVKKGDFLVELDSSALEEERTAQKINCNTAEAMVIEAKNVYETAVIAKREYLEGIYLETRQTIESEVFVAEENLNRAKEYYEYSKKLATKGYVNDLQLEADKFAVEKSAKELEAAKTKLKVLDDFTKVKTVKELESDIRIAEAKWESETNSYELEAQKLSEIEEQIERCTILSPRDGIVKYAHSRDHRGNNDFIVEEGAVVRERQEIIHLPNPGKMQVEIKINESQIQYVSPGMLAKVAPIGMGDILLQGAVRNVNQYAEPSGWRKANVKEYKAYVNVDDPSGQIRAGMTASVTIECMRISDAVLVPVQAVYAHGPKHFCIARKKGGWEAIEVHCGPTNDKFFVIENGLQEQDQVALNPRRYLKSVELPELAPEQQQRAVPQKGLAQVKSGAEKSGAKKPNAAVTEEAGG